MNSFAQRKRVSLQIFLLFKKEEEKAETEEIKNARHLTRETVSSNFVRSLLVSSIILRLSVGKASEFASHRPTNDAPMSPPASYARVIIVERAWNNNAMRQRGK